MVDFVEWPKTPRLFREICITEKIDGTNAALHIVENPDLPGTYSITAQSRKRIVTPDSDNYGFARWAHANASELIELLGPGLHFGEWWGRSIQRTYGTDKRAFSLFNVDRHKDTKAVIDGVYVQPVPVMYQGPFSDAPVRACLTFLKTHGSLAVPGFGDPEGICVWHSQSRKVYKVTLDNSDAGKWENPAAVAMPKETRPAN
ncbi:MULTISPECIES: RNA ligase family protein [unclassified Kitasatospora]|uniref:RNA ligase family protein n=1 Tax=unclassified Kitasatospora TaxID=2633591 RepID=UPI002476077E|nr:MULTISPECIES: RNA ligase family protein [unclassified Kitasatospora]MDH6123847.1 hypothetical protein [Kitasatospora sp. GP82]MDH6576054.1 hypothetical protein [Kitasatospora sp. MAP5-34]